MNDLMMMVRCTPEAFISSSNISAVASFSGGFLVSGRPGIADPWSTREHANRAVSGVLASGAWPGAAPACRRLAASVPASERVPTSLETRGDSSDRYSSDA